MKLSALMCTISEVEKEHIRLTGKGLNSDTEIDLIEIPFYDTRLRIVTKHNEKTFCYIRDISL